MSLEEKEKDIVHTEMLQDDKQRSGDSIKDDASDEVVANVARRRAEERRLVRKLDMRLLPMIILIYIVNYIDVRPLSFEIFRYS